MFYIVVVQNHFALAITFQPMFYVNIDESMELKKAAIGEHKSEVKRGTVNFKKVEERATKRGNEIGAGFMYAEAFMFSGEVTDKQKIMGYCPFLINKIT